VAVIFKSTQVEGAYILDVEEHRDERGFFARTWCEEEFERHGAEPSLSQASISFNHRAGTLRGIHYQSAPHEEAKVVRCTRGSIWDVIVDLRSGSPTSGEWAAFELAADTRRSLYIPKGVAHGFQTLADDTEVLYLISERHQPDAGLGVRFDDPAFGIEWPRQVTVISERDATWPDYAPR
jgi:dTDP-4-dehydrorhamnose 3,5-epimerase